MGKRKFQDPDLCADGYDCRLAIGCAYCDQDQSVLTQVANQRRAGLTSSPRYWRLSRLVTLKFNNWQFALGLYRKRRATEPLHGELIESAQIEFQPISTQATWPTLEPESPPGDLCHLTVISAITNSDPPENLATLHRDINLGHVAGSLPQAYQLTA